MRYPDTDALLRRKLPDDQRALLGSLDGWLALQLLMPLIRELAMFLDGGPEPNWVAMIPGLKSEAALERLRIRREKQRARDER